VRKRVREGGRVDIAKVYYYPIERSGGSCRRSRRRRRRRRNSRREEKEQRTPCTPPPPRYSCDLQPVVAPLALTNKTRRFLGPVFWWQRGFNCCLSPANEFGLNCLNVNYNN